MMSDDRVEWHLWNWGRWHRTPTECYPNHSAGEATEAALNGMAPRLRLAIYMQYGIVTHAGAVYRIRGSVEAAFAEAKSALAILLSQRGMF